MQLIFVIVLKVPTGFHRIFRGIEGGLGVLPWTIFEQMVVGTKSNFTFHKCDVQQPLDETKQRTIIIIQTPMNKVYTVRITY